MNNPLLFTDPSGYYAAPRDREKPKTMSFWDPWGSNINYNQFEDFFAEGRWRYNGGGYYENWYSGEQREVNDANTGDIAEEMGNVFFGRTYTLVEAQAVLGIVSREILGTDCLGNQEVLITNNKTGKMTVQKDPFWRITGSYYNHLYYFSGLAAYSPNEAFRFAANGGGIDWKGVGNATLLMAGGFAEMAIGGIVEFFSAGTSTPLTVPMMIDGAGRTVANAQRLGMYLKGNNKMANAYPTSLGAAVGKFGDLATGTSMDQVGFGQALGGTLNDFTSFVVTGGSGFALENAVMNPTAGNFLYYSFTYGSYIYSMGENSNSLLYNTKGR